MPSLALLAILVITAGWWALALWPAGAVEPEWLQRTRAVCFGSMPGGLPDVGGWIVLIGEPIGMLAALFFMWGSSLRDDLRRLSADVRWRPVLLVVALATTLGLVKTVQRVTYMSGLGQSLPVAQSRPIETVDIDVSSFALVDQHGRRASLAELGSPAILTFAFGHCATVCPTVVHDVRSARAAAKRTDVPLVVITLDPWRDTPEHLSMIATAWELDAGDLVLSDSIVAVGRVLDALGVARTRNEQTGDIEHANVIMVTDGRGHVVQRLDGWWGRVNELFTALPAPRPVSPDSLRARNGAP